MTQSVDSVTPLGYFNIMTTSKLARLLPVKPHIRPSHPCNLSVDIFSHQYPKTTLTLEHPINFLKNIRTK
jgi:hypothetical protein